MLPGQDILNVPRRVLDIEDYIDIVRRHKGWIIGPTLACLVAGVVGAFLWPDTYVSSAMVRVIPPQVPERYVPANINQDITNRVNSIYQSVTSRATLTNIINLYQLYPRDRKRLPMEDVIEQMRKDIRVNFVNSQKQSANPQLQAFEISYFYENRHLAQKIVNELVTRFIDENIRTRASQSVMTTDFLKDQWEQRKRDLEEAEKKLTQFRVSNSGRLPEERVNLQTAVSSIETRIGNLNSQISRSNQDKLLLESRLSILKEQLKIARVPESSQRAEAAKSERLATLDREIQLNETRLESMRQNYKDTHPDVKQLVSTIEAMKKTRDSIQTQETAKAAEDATRAKEQAATSSRSLTREARALEAEIQTVQTMIEARAMEVDNYTKEMQGAERNLRTYQGKLETIPSGISEYEELLREKTLAQTKYEEMNLKMSQSQSATDLENRKQGETLELLDPASLPMTPQQPNRPMVIAAATGIGFLLGLVIAGVREMKDTTLKNLKDVRAYTHLMVLGSVPILENDLVIRRRRRMSWLAWTTASLAGIVVIAGSIVFYYANKA